MEVVEALPLVDPKFDKDASAEKMVKHTTIFELHIGTPGFKKSINSAHFMEVLKELSEDDISALSADMKKLVQQAMAEIEENSDGNTSKADPSMIHVSQDLIDRKFIAAIAKRDKQFTNWIKAKQMRSPLKFQGAYLVRLSDFKLITASVKAFIKEREDLIDKFEEKWNSVIEDAKAKRGPFFDSADYPPFSTVRIKYDVEYRWVNFNVPGALKDLDDDLYKEEAEKAKAFFVSAAQDARDAARVAFQELNEHLLAQLGTDESGKQKRFMGKSISKYMEFISMFLTGGDLTGDDDLKKMCLKARDILSNVDPSDVRKEEALRDTLSKAVSTIKDEASKLIVVSGRKFFKDGEDSEQEALSLT